jgi:membrane protein implicated in regulation of membrane protease activity
LLGYGCLCCLTACRSVCFAWLPVVCVAWLHVVCVVWLLWFVLLGCLLFTLLMLLFAVFSLFCNCVSSRWIAGLRTAIQTVTHRHTHTHDVCGGISDFHKIDLFS